MSRKLFAWGDFNRVAKAVTGDVPITDTQWENFLKTLQTTKNGLESWFTDIGNISPFIGFAGYRYSNETAEVLWSMVDLFMRMIDAFPAGNQARKLPQVLQLLQNVFGISLLYSVVLDFLGIDT